MHSIRTLILIRVTICFLGQFLHSQRPQFVLACAGQILPGILAAHWQQQESKPHTLRGSAHQRIQLPKQFQHSHRLSNKIILCHSNQLLLCCMVLAHLPLSAFLISLGQTGKGKLHFWYHLCRTVSPTEFPPIQKSESCRKHQFSLSPFCSFFLRPAVHISGGKTKPSATPEAFRGTCGTIPGISPGQRSPLCPERPGRARGSLLPPAARSAPRSAGSGTGAKNVQEQFTPRIKRRHRLL